jgi:hypothetical protein
LDPVSAAHHFVLRRARDDPRFIAGFLKSLGDNIMACM